MQKCKATCNFDEKHPILFHFVVLFCRLHHVMWSNIHNVWGHLRTIEFGRKFSWFQWNLPYIIIFFLCVKSHIYIYTHIPHTPDTFVPSPFNHASASPTMDRVPAVPDLHADVRGDGSSPHQFGLWAHCMQDVPEQAAPQGLSLWPDGHQYRHRAVACQHCPTTTGGGTGETWEWELCVRDDW